MAKIPSSIGKYKITEEIAQGGMGAVYKGEHPTLDRSIIIKKLTLRGNSSLKERFRREARIMMDFKNDNIVQVYDHFRQGSYYYIVQEYIDGISLEDLLRRERYLPSDIALLIFYDLCRALKYAHDKGVVHRDVKPGNVLLSKKGEVKLVDFGVAASREYQEDGLTREGMTLGTPSYMAPEQFRNTRNVDKRADIYSAGVLLYEMVTGKKPFPGDLSPANIRQIQQGKYRPPRKHNPAVNKMALRIIRKTMKRKPKRRYQDLAPLIKTLSKYLKHRNEGFLRKQLVRIIHGESYVLKSGRKTRRFFKAVLWVLLLLFVAGGASYYLYSEGYHYEWFLAGEYGAVKVSAKIRKNEQLEDLRPLKLNLYRLSEGELERLEEPGFTFSENPLKETGDYYFSESRKRYLEKGSYRVKLASANHIAWFDFDLEARRAQRGDPERDEGRLLTVTMNEAEPVPLRIDYRILDGETGADISDSVRAAVLQDGRRVALSPFQRAMLRTGSVYTFFFNMRGYREKRFDLIIAPGQSELYIETVLSPR